MSAIDQPLESLARAQMGRTSSAIQLLRGRNFLFGVLLVVGPIALYFPLWVLANRMTSESAVETLDHTYRAYIIVSELWGLVKLLSSRREEEA